MHATAFASHSAPNPGTGSPGRRSVSTRQKPLLQKNWSPRAVQSLVLAHGASQKLVGAATWHADAARCTVDETHRAVVPKAGQPPAESQLSVHTPHKQTYPASHDPSHDPRKCDSLPTDLSGAGLHDPPTRLTAVSASEAKNVLI